MIVVTGANGHVGANLVRELLRRGARVRAVIHRRDDALRGLEVERVPGDVRDPDSLRRAFDGAEIVYHLAAVISITGDRGGLVSAVNVAGVRNVVDAALDRRVKRLVHFSSLHAFEQEPFDEPLDEGRPRVSAADRPAYDRSKAAGEREVRAGVERGLDAVIVNPSGILGPYDFEPSRMGRLLLRLHHGTLPALIGGGFDWVDVRDVVASALAAAERGRTGESYLLSGEWRSVPELARLAAAAGARPPRLTCPDALARAVAPAALVLGKLTRREPLFTPESLRALRSNRKVVHDKATRELGHAPRPLENTVRDAYAWFAEAGIIKARGELPARSLAGHRHPVR